MNHDRNPNPTRDRRLRRMAERQGYRIEVSRRRDPRAVDYAVITVVNDRDEAVAELDGWDELLVWLATPRCNEDVLSARWCELHGKKHVGDRNRAKRLAREQA